MARRFLIFLFALGTLGGFGSGIASMACHHRQRQQAFEQHVAQVCVDAAMRSQHGQTRTTPPSDR